MSASEVITLRYDIPGVGLRGDKVVIMPDHPDSAFRLTRVVPLPPSVLPALLAHSPTAKIRKKKRGRVGHLQLMEDSPEA